MDADFSHDPADLPRLLAAAETAGLALGSRYVEGGGTENWGKGRQAISRFGSFYARTILGVPVTTSPADSSAGAARRSRRSPSTGSTKGYAFQIETTYRAIRAGFGSRRFRSSSPSAAPAARR